MQENCIGCGAVLKDSFINSNLILPDEKIKLINEYASDKKEQYCNKCGAEPLKSSMQKVGAELEQLRNFIARNLPAVPLASIHTPLNWDYEVVGIVTGQSVTGTGVISEFASSFTDLFGGQSGRFNKKLRGGENLCGAQIRKAALEDGANAIIGLDIDYAEVGGEKGMLMVCMTGTSIKLNNVTILGDKRAETIIKLSESVRREKYLSTISGSL